MTGAQSFLKHHLGAAAPENPEVEALRLEVAELKEKYEAVLEENRKLKAKVGIALPPSLRFASPPLAEPAGPVFESSRSQGQLLIAPGLFSPQLAQYEPPQEEKRGE
ncbi:hypothetical protein JD844_005126 [Phrynosoma platyrhinos]|uniref:Uncharacterized protein n=1 Tax=Phrynosoma platyrhinos TaxID=52577 RepID=A0ABQ7TMK3_PHRPL|nr:hypothetical protein JD844_005126 [Phrynosoma platyrhinos]